MITTARIEGLGWAASSASQVGSNPRNGGNRIEKREVGWGWGWGWGGVPSSPRNKNDHPILPFW